jgi:hypothetical protein
MMRHTRRQWLPSVVLAVAILLVGAILVFGVAYRNTGSTVIAQVRDKERVCNSTSEGSDCRYLVYTDQGTYAVEDSFIFWRFNSSDVYGSIERGKTYSFYIVGWRIPFASVYPNIIRHEELSR